MVVATFGIEGIRYFANSRASGGTGDDLTYTFNICNGLDQKLGAAGHIRFFYWANDDCFETDLRDTSLGGDDSHWADNVDLFFINSHGGFWDGRGHILYDVMQTKWAGDQNDYRLGDNNLEWLLVYGCDTINRDDPSHLWPAFQRLHEFCGAYDSMCDSPTTDECGEDVGDDLTSGTTVCGSWIDGVSDWWIDNHPMVVAVEIADTFNGGNVDWGSTIINRDHLWGHGETVSDILPADQFFLSWYWSEG